MTDSPSFDRLLSGVHRGASDEVGAMVVQRFTSRLMALAAGKIGEQLRRKADADDVVQSVYRTFFRRLNDGQLVLSDWESLWGLLARIAAFRVYRQAARNAAARRDQKREIALTDDLEVFNRDPSGEEVMMAVERCEQLIAGLPEQYRLHVGLHLDGATHAEIARQLGTSISTVERVRRLARQHLKALLAKGA